MFKNEYIKRFWSKVEKKSDNECWEWKGSLLKNGYGKIGYGANSKLLAHRLSFMIHNNKEIEEGKYILHSCDNRKCVNPFHLREGTQQDNMNDKKERNRNTFGEKNGLSKLTEQQVLEIRNKYIPRKYTLKMLATEYNVSYQSISIIINNKTWTHV